MIQAIVKDTKFHSNTKLCGACHSAITSAHLILREKSDRHCVRFLLSIIFSSKEKREKTR